LNPFIADLIAAGQVDRVSRQVDPWFELAAVTLAAQKASERPLLFENVAGTAFPVATNLYGSHKRLCDLIGATDGLFAPRWLDLTRGGGTPNPPSSVPDFVAHEASSISALPRITYHERDGGAYFTSAIYYARDPQTGCPNLSFHRSSIEGDNELRVRLGTTHDLTRYQALAEADGKPLPAALLLSVAPSIFMAACASLPYEDSELDLAERIAGRPLPMRPCVSIDLDVPCEADIVVEGHFLPNVRRPEGPFGEFMGSYVDRADQHVFQVTAVTARPGAVFHSLLCGSAEDLRPLEATMAARVYRHLRETVRGVIDVSCRPGVQITIVKIAKQYEGHGKHALLAALGSNLDYNKVVFVVDEDVDIYDLEDVMWAYMTRGRADTRAMIIPDVPGFYRDAHKDHWGRLAIDATKPWGREAEFDRKRVPGFEGVDLAAYLAK
jgi:UbiD family decarboxylase